MNMFAFSEFTDGHMPSYFLVCLFLRASLFSYSWTHTRPIGKQTHRQKRTEKVLITTVFPNCVSIHVTFWPQVGQARQKVLGQAYAYIAYIQYNMTLKFPHQVTRDSTFQ